jgi:hypothetical protein
VLYWLSHASSPKFWDFFLGYQQKFSCKMPFLEDLSLQEATRGKEFEIEMSHKIIRVNIQAFSDTELKVRNYFTH